MNRDSGTRRMSSTELRLRKSIGEITKEEIEETDW
jgi:hypothetical protein